MRLRGGEILLFAAFTAAGLLALEGATRVLAPQVGWRPFEDPELGWSTREYQRLDSDGDGPKRRRRLLFLGDSYLAGSGVRTLGERFPALMQDALGDTARVRILASGGWGPDQQYLAFLRRGRPWAPDLVVVAFCANNDLVNVVSNRHPTAGRKPYFVPDGAGGLLFLDAEGAPAFLPEGPLRTGVPPMSYLWDFLRFRIGGLFGRTEPEQPESGHPPHGRPNGSEERLLEVISLHSPLSWAPQEGGNHLSAYVHGDFPDTTYQWGLVEALLGELRDAVRDGGGRLAVMLLPTTLKARDLRFVVGSSFRFEFQTPRGLFTFRADEPRERLRGIAERLEVPLLDPTSAFLARVRAGDLAEEVWAAPPDRHFSRAGHEIMAELTLRELRKQGLLRPAPEQGERP